LKQVSESKYHDRSGSTSLGGVFDYIDKNQDKFIQNLLTLVRQPSVAAKHEGIEECAALVRDMVSKQLDTDSRVLRIDGASPLVTAEIKSRSNPGKTVIFYNHYDVQPPEPLDLWDSPPFEPVMKDGKVYGRGVADDKAELTGRLALTESFLRTTNDVPCNFRFVFEGEEEIGSVNLHKYKKQNPDLFRADGAIWEFGSVDAKERPVVTLGVKGILYVELTARNAIRDAHSSVAAIVDNPAWRLVHALNTIKKGEKILVPGWYDDVRKFTASELKLLEEQPSEESELKRELGLKGFIGGIKGLELKKALAGKPTCTICGMISGYTGPGSKTVLPKDASVKIDFRLVPEQDPSKLAKMLRRHLNSGGFRDIKITHSEGEPAARTSHEDPIARASVTAAQNVYGKRAVMLVSSAGTGPMFLFDAPCVAIGGGYPGSRAHSPNENARLDLFAKGMKWVAETVDRFAKS
jgi:acetylornithine deacetylase/succinyl-diaminopimelate desuccinylase-like protein